MGRPRVRLKRDDYLRVEAMASVGATKVTIAKQLGISPVTFRKIIQRDPKAEAAFETGRQNMQSHLVRSLFETGMDRSHSKHVTACIALLKMVHGLTDQPKPQAQESRVSVEVRLPAALSTGQYQQMLDVVPKRKLIEEKIVNHDDKGTGE